MWSEESYYTTAELGSENYQHPGMQLLQRLSSKAHSIVDLGCGEGTRLHYLCSKGTSCLGIDVSETAIRLAKKKYEKLSFQVGDLEELPLKDNKYDLVYSAFVLEHVDNPETIIKEAIRITKPRGNLVFIAPNYGSPNRTSPPSKASRVSKLITGFLQDVISDPSTLGWHKVTPIAGKDKYEIDWDTTVEPYARSLLKYLNNQNVKVVYSSTCWEEEIEPKLHQKLFRILGEMHMYPFMFWGPHIVIHAVKN